MPSSPKPALDTPPGSVSRWMLSLRDGDHAAVQRLWDRYFQPLVCVARGRLKGAPRCLSGAEDVALEAFWELCGLAARPDAVERFPDLCNRTQFWRLLVCFTVRRAFDFRRKEGRRGMIVCGESALGEAGFGPFVGREPAPEFAEAVNELLGKLGSEKLRRLALLRMEGYSREEIGKRFGWSVATVDRKLKVIRRLWKDWDPAERKA